MDIISFNVNGLRAILNKGFKEWFERQKPDVLCLQEIKVKENQIKLENFLDLKDYNVYWNSDTSLFIFANFVLVSGYLPRNT